MVRMTRVLSVGSQTQLGSPGAALRFSAAERPEGGSGGRFLQLDEEDAFELSFWCGTCPLLFRRLKGANRSLSITGIQDRLNAGLEDVDGDIVQILSAELLPAGPYLPILLEVRPDLVTPMQEGDYFAHEQLEHRGPDSFWGLPQFPQTQYYRAGTYPISATDTVFEFVVPMVPPYWNDAKRVQVHERQLLAGGTPTALALSIIDVTQPWNSPLAHWGLTHFLLDGHHKVDAAARRNLPLRILCVIALEEGLAGQEEISRVLSALAR